MTTEFPRSEHDSDPEPFDPDWLETGPIAECTPPPDEPRPGIDATGERGNGLDGPDPGQPFPAVD